MLERSLPRAAYVDATVWERERELVLNRSWMCVGRADQVAATPGSYRLIDLQGESILAVRGADGTVGTFANLCRHRGAQLVDSSGAEGAVGCFGAMIRCPYHQWTYSTDGSWRTAPDVGGLDPTDLGLYQRACDSWGGFLFVRRSPDGPPLAAELGGVVDRLGNYPLADLVIGARLTYEVAANWKVLAENYNECYHCGPVHPELCDLVPSFRQGGGSDLDWERGIPHRPGAYTFTTAGTTSRRPFPGLSADELVNHKGELIYPNLFLSLSCDHVAAFTLWSWSSPANPAQGAPSAGVRRSP